MDIVTSQDGTVIAFDRAGVGAPLILVSGATCDRRVDARHADALAEHFTVFNYDRRGRGDSTDTSPYSVDREIEDIAAIAAVAAAAGMDDRGPVLVGLSSGAVLAALAAARVPVASLVMWEPPFALDEAGRNASRAYASELGRLLDAGDRDGAFTLFLRNVGIPEPAIAGMRQSPHWAGGVALAHTLAYDATVMGDGAIPADDAAALTTPTLVLAGEASPDFLRDAAGAAAAAIPGAQFRALPGQTHDVAPDALTTAILGFVSQAVSR